MSLPPLLDRLKQSAVFQAIGLFVGASWIVLQVVDVLTERLGLPHWIFPLTLILLGVGLVVVLATSWVQSRPSTTLREKAGELPSDWELAPREMVTSLKAGKLPHLNWARVALGGAVALSLLFGLGGLYVLTTGRGTSLGPTEVGANEGTAGIAILPFTVNASELQAWEHGIVDLLAPGLDGVGGYRTIASRTVLSRWNDRIPEGNADLAMALRVAGETGARYAMTGTVVALGPTVRLNADIYDLADGSKVAEGEAEGSVEEVLALVDELGLDAIRDLVGKVGRDGGGEGVPARLTTTSLAAARAFLAGEDHFRAGRFEDALRGYQEAMASDSSFALATWRAYLALLYIGDQEQIVAMEPRLVAGLDDLPARDRTLARLRLEISGDSLRSAEPAEQAVLRYPDDPEAWYMLGEVRYHEPGMAGGGHASARAAFDKAIELAPGFIPYYYHAIEYAIGAGDRVRAQALVDLVEAAVPDDPQLDRIRLSMALLLDPPEQARERARAEIGAALDVFLTVPLSTSVIPRVWAALEDLPVAGDVRATDLMSAWAMAVGREREAFELMRSLPLGTGRRVTLARHHQDVLGDLPGLDPELEFRVSYCGAKDIPAQAACYEKAALRAVDAARYAEARRIAAEQDSIAAAHENPRAARIHRRLARTVEGYMAWKQGDVPGALRSLEEARQLDMFAVSARWYLAEVLVEAGRPREAVALLLSIDDSPTWSPFARLKVAELLESMGDGVGAATQYQAALAAWVDADEGFSPRARAEAGLGRVSD